MKIKSIEVFKFFIKLNEPLSISFHTFHFNENFLVRIESTDGQVGWGEGAPFESITGDSIDSVSTEAPRLASLIGAEFNCVEDSFAALERLIKSPTLRAASDFAFHDILAREKGVPVYKLLTAEARTVPNSLTVFLKDTPDESALETSRLLNLFPHSTHLKIKLSGVGDIERCRAIAARGGPHLSYVLDANQGFDSGERAAMELNEIIDILGSVVLIEEPCKKGALEKAKIVTERVPRSVIAADESCCSMHDLEEIIEQRAFNGINIKLQKAGGITPGLRLAKRAEQAGIKVMVGQMFETPLSTAASLACAVASRAVLFTDLDMDLELVKFSTGMADFIAGKRVPLEVPGFGFQLDDVRVADLRREGTIIQELMWSSFPNASRYHPR